MIVILASQLDPEADALVSAWSASGAALLSAKDLGSPGWIFKPTDPGSGIAVVAGQRIKFADLRAVLTRRPAVIPEELTHIDPVDRSYVASETNAFLVAWLKSLKCPVINRPTSTSLCGPLWSELHWRMAVAHAGLAWATAHDIQEREVIVCGQKCLFADTSRQKNAALRLARLVDVELLSIRFRGDEICGVSVAPEIKDEALRACLLSRIVG